MSDNSNGAQYRLKRPVLFSIVFLGIAVVGSVGMKKGSADSNFPTDARRGLPTRVVQQTRTAEQVYKNIQVFKGLPASDLEPAMAFISGSLGVKCNHCHVNPFAKDEKPTKQAARRMIQMVLDLNKGSFGGAKAVTCFTCHRGKPLPVSVPAVGQNLWQPNPAVPKEDPLPSVDLILERYVAALGGAPALQKVTTRVAKGSRVGADGVLVPEDVFQKAPDKLLTVTSYPDNVFSTGFNGRVGWGKSSKEGQRDLPAPVLTQLKNDSEFYKELKTKELYLKLSLVGKSTIGEREAYVIEATPLTGNPEKLYFDVDTGLLLRKYVESETFLGMFPLQTDYEDYRVVDGVNQPFLIRWSMPGRSWGRKIVEIKQNVEIDDSRFSPPAPKN